MSERTERLLARLNRQASDDHWVEAKSGVGKLDTSFWSTVSAFANGSGGIIVLGISEDQRTGHFSPASDFDYHAANDRLINAFRPGQESPAVTPIPRHTIEADEVEGSPVIIVEIFGMRTDPWLGGQMPCYVSKQGVRDGSYKRVLDGDVRLSTYEVLQLASLREVDRSEVSPVAGASLQDLDSALCGDLLGAFSASGSRVLYGVQSETEGLRRLDVVDSSDTPTLAGLLALGSYPQQFFPQLYIDVAVHPGASKSMEPTRFLDRKRCDGALPYAVEGAINGVLRNIRTRSVEDGSRMIDVPEIPEIALREAIVNAAMHRDYHPMVQGRQIAVDVYPDRVEINSPGGLWGDRTLDNLDENRSTTRNPRLANLLSNLPTPIRSARVAENQGSGIQRMRIAMERHGLPDPEFRASIGDFTVILYRDQRSTAEPAFEQPAEVEQAETDPVLRALRSDVPASAREVAERSGLALATVRPKLKALVESGAVAATAPPTSRNRKYLRIAP